MTKADSPAEFDIADLDAIDTADMTVMSYGRPTTWVWTFSGPGHPKAVELSDRLSRERLRRAAEQEQAQVNGKKWKAESESPEELIKRNAERVADRLLGWSPVKFNGQDYPFSRENAIALLTDPKKGDLAMQALEFLADQKSFTPRSSKAS